MRVAARGALGEVTAERTGAAARQRPQRSAVAEGDCGAEALEVVRAVPDGTVGNAGHRECRRTAVSSWRVSVASSTAGSVRALR